MGQTMGHAQKQLTFCRIEHLSKTCLIYNSPYPCANNRKAQQSCVGIGKTSHKASIHNTILNVRIYNEQPGGCMWASKIIHGNYVVLKLSRASSPNG